MTDDFLDRVIRAIAEAAVAGGPAAVLEVELALRREWGGDRPYIRKAPVGAKVAVVVREVGRGAKLREALERSGFGNGGRQYGLLSRKWSNP